MLDVLLALNDGAQRATSLREVAEQIMHAGQRLGFMRLRLWRITRDQVEAVGLMQVGGDCFDTFEGFCLAVNTSPHLTRSLSSRDPILCTSTTSAQPGRGHRFRFFEHQMPEGDWIALSLWGQMGCLGVLMLDAPRRQADVLEPSLIRELVLFGQVATSLIERAIREHEADRGVGSIVDVRRSLESEVLVNVSTLAADYVVRGELRDLLQRVHACISRIIEANNCYLVLLDQEEGWLDFLLRVEDGKHQPRFWRQQSSGGLTAHLIERNCVLWLPKGGRLYREQHGIPLFGRQSQSWLGVPLSVAGTAIGALVVQSYDQPERYTQADADLLAEIAHRVAGTVQATAQRERSEANRLRLTTLLEASQRLTSIAAQSIEYLWRVALNIITADYGLGFNRAMLFLSDQYTTALREALGVGNIEEHAAHEDWERDIERGQTFAQYLAELQAGEDHRGTVDQMMRRLRQPLSDRFPQFLAAVRSGRPTPIDTEVDAGVLPSLFVETFGKTVYGLVPIRSAERLLGIVVVDNKHNREPFRTSRLNQLENWLAHVVLVYEQQSTSRAMAAELEFMRTVLEAGHHAEAREDDLIQHILNVAQQLVGQDDARIGLRLRRQHPSQDGRGPHEEVWYQDVLAKDTPHVGSAPGEETWERVMTGHTVTTELTPNVVDSIQPHKRSELKVELRMESPSNPVLGTISVESPHVGAFSASDKRKLERLAITSAVVFGNIRQLQELQRAQELREAENRIFAAIGSSYRLEETVDAVLKAVGDLFGAGVHRALLTYNKERHFLAFASPSQNYYPQENLGRFITLKIDQEAQGSVACAVARESLRTGKVSYRNVGDGQQDPYYLSTVDSLRSELCVSLMSTDTEGKSGELLGVLVLESEQVTYFNHRDVERIVRISRPISFAIERAYIERRYRLEQAVANTTAWAAEIAHDLRSEVANLQLKIRTLKKFLAPEDQQYTSDIEAITKRLASFTKTASQKLTNIELHSWMRAFVPEFLKENGWDSAITFRDTDLRGAIHIRVTEALLSRVMKHLIRNAVEAMEEQDRGTIDVRTEQNEGEGVVAVFVGNSGPYITLEVHQKLFDIPNPSRKEKGADRGIGLLYVQNALEQMGGTITIWSTPEEPTVFRFTLPINPSDEEREEGNR